MRVFLFFECANIVIMFKDKLKIFICLCLGLLFLSPICFAEEIESFDSKIIINKNNILNVTETIVYDFGDAQKHGIYRYFKEDNNLIISNVSVTDENGNAYKFTFSNNKIKIGDEYITICGEKTYIIHYNLKKAINYFKDYDELYLNVNGFDWQVPINKIRTEVVIPKNLENDFLFFESYYGAYGSKNMATSRATFAQNTTNIIFESSSLDIGENLTILARFPKNIVQKPFIVNIDNIVLFVPVFVFIFMFLAWLKYGRVPKNRGTIISEYNAINNLTPIEIGTLIDEKIDNIDISAEIIYLAEKGYMTITRIKKKILFVDQIDYSLKKIKETDDDLNDFDKEILDFLFNGEDEVMLSKIDKSGTKDLFVSIKQKVWKKLLKDGYFYKNRFNNVIAIFIFINSIIVMLSFFAKQLLIAFSFFFSSMIVILFVVKFSKLTQKGSEARESIQGFKLYLSVAEKDRINFHNAPEKNPKTFEKLLPYAMVLGVEKKWAKQFEGMYVDSNWYKNVDGKPITQSALFTIDLNNFSNLTNNQFNVMHSSRSSGFSGGGVSQGGGGSW